MMKKKIWMIGMVPLVSDVVATHEDDHHEVIGVFHMEFNRSPNVLIHQPKVPAVQHDDSSPLRASPVMMNYLQGLQKQFPQYKIPGDGLFQTIDQK